MKRTPLAVSLIAVGAAAVLGWTGCESNTRGGPGGKVFRTQVAVEIVTRPDGSKRAVMVYDNFYVHHGGAFKFYTDGCNLQFNSPASRPDGLFKGKPGSGTVVNTVIGDTLGSYEVSATCDGLPVESNSPPIIIVDN